MENYSASDGDTKMKNKLRKDKNRGSRVRVIEAMVENASQHAWKKKITLKGRWRCTNWRLDENKKTRVKRQQVILSRRETHALINHEHTRVDKYNVFIPIDSNIK